MTETHGVVIQTARRAAARLTALRSTRAAVRTSAIVLAILIAASVANAVLPLATISLLFAVTASIAAGVMAAFVVALFRPVDALSAVRVLDVGLHLDERSSTALELVRARRALSTMGVRVLADAGERLSAVNLRQVFPWRLPREAWWIPVLILTLTVWTFWFHGLAIPGTPAYRTQQAIRREGERLEQFAQSLQARARAGRLLQTRRSAPQIQDLGVRLQRERVDRTEALARIAELSRQIEAARQQIGERLQAVRPPAGGASMPQELLTRQALERQIRQLQELTSRIRQEPSAASKDALDRLGEVTKSLDGQQPAQVQSQLQKAREQLEHGDLRGAGESLTEALRELEGLDSMLADREGLSEAQQQLQRSRANIASSGAGPDSLDREESRAEQRSSPSGPGQTPPSSESSPEASPPPPGPHQGTLPGTGRVDQKLGQPGPRLQIPRSPQHLRGAQSEGGATVSEILGSGRPGPARVQPSAVTPTLVVQADQAMERSRIPGWYRTIVRRYFERLARLR